MCDSAREREVFGCVVSVGSFIYVVPSQLSSSSRGSYMSIHLC